MEFTEQQLTIIAYALSFLLGKADAPLRKSAIPETEELLRDIQVEEKWGPDPMGVWHGTNE